MAENTKISWCDHTTNWWWGCTKASPACDHCYAETLDARFHGQKMNIRQWPEGVLTGRHQTFARYWGPGTPRLLRIAAARQEVLKYERRAMREGRRFRIFHESMGDFFEDRRDLDQARLDALDTMRLTPHLDHLLLTKRPEKILDCLRQCLIPSYRAERHDLNAWLEEWLAGNAPANIWLGATVEDQERANQRIPALLHVPAAVRFLSCEPLLGPVNLTHMDVESHPAAEHLGRLGAYQIDALTGRNTDMARPCPDVPHLNWVITGGETKAGARPTHPDWFRSLRDQCAAAGVPFNFKQWGRWIPGDVHDYCTNDDRCQVVDPEEGLLGRPWLGWGKDRPGRTIMLRAGKKSTGRLLDGVLHDEYPKVSR